MRAPLRLAAPAALAALMILLAPSASVARAQVITPPVGGGAIKAAKRNVEKTNEQTQAAEKAEKAGAQPQKAQQAPQKSAPAPQKTTTAPNQKAAPPAQKAGAKAPASRADTGSGVVSQAGGRRNQVQVFREQFAYTDGGRRDPFVSLMLSGELRPVITDLVLTGVIADRDPRRSMALLVDGSTGESYRVRMGQQLGRMRVTRIDAERITFTFDEFGLSRTETLTIDRTKQGGAAPPRRP
jgi:hypothetical protein